MEVIHKISMDLARCRDGNRWDGDHPWVNVVQGDTNARILELTLLENGGIWEVPEGASVRVRYRKRDNTGGSYDTLPDGTKAWSGGGNVLKIALAPQMMTVDGEVQAQVEIVLGDARIATFAIFLMVERDPSLGIVESEDYVNWLAWINAEVQTQVSAIVDAVNADAETAAQSASKAIEAAKEAAASVELLEQAIAPSASELAAKIAGVYTWEQWDTDPSVGARKSLYEPDILDSYGGGMSEFYEYNYADSLIFVNGKLALENPVTAAAPIVVDDLYILRGKYVQSLAGLIYIPADANFWFFNNKWQTSNAFLVTDATRLEIVTSDNPYAYPNEGEQGGLWYIASRQRGEEKTGGGSGADGKSAYEYAQEGGYVGTEEAFGKKLAEEPLIGTTAEITPAQVSEALAQGRAVYISHQDNAYGVMSFTSFACPVTALNCIISSTVFEAGGMAFCANLTGSLSSNTWSFQAIVLALQSDFPTIPTALPNPNALTINGVSYNGSAPVNLTIEGGDSIPNYVKTEAERVAKVVQSRQNANTVTFLACSDIHYSSPDNASPISNAQNLHDGILHMGQAMGIIRQKVHIDFAAMLGDMFRDNGEADQDEILAEVRFVNSCLRDGFSGIPVFRAEGNHDEAYESGIGLSASQVFANIHAWNAGAVFGNREAGYCYRDFDGLKLRVVCLNTSEVSGSSLCLSAEQASWLTGVLDLSEKGEDWRSLILSHHPLDFGRNGGVDPTSVIDGAYGLIGVVHGHLHNFKVDTISGTTVKRIAIPNACRDQENGYGVNNGINFGESTKYPKTAGTAEDTSFCVVTIDLAEQKIYADHYGAGYSREIDYTVKSAGAGYTNLVPTSEATDSTEPFNGTGYQNGAYASSSGTGTDAECVVTGLIPYGDGRTDPIYVKGAAIDTSKSHCRILGFNAAKEAQFQSAQGSALTTYFSIETLGANYYKVTPLGNSTAGGTITAYLRFSLIGTGENLIITINEPIE